MVSKCLLCTVHTCVKCECIQLVCKSAEWNRSNTFGWRHSHSLILVLGTSSVTSQRGFHFIYTKYDGQTRTVQEETAGGPTGQGWQWQSLIWCHCADSRCAAGEPRRLGVNGISDDVERRLNDVSVGWGRSRRYCGCGMMWNAHVPVHPIEMTSSSRCCSLDHTQTRISHTERKAAFQNQFEDSLVLQSLASYDDTWLLQSASFVCY